MILAVCGAGMYGGQMLDLPCNHLKIREMTLETTFVLGFGIILQFRGLIGYAKWT